jgi:hypothetical protein
MFLAGIPVIVVLIIRPYSFAVAAATLEAVAINFA